MVNILVILLLAFSMVASIAALLNTQTILRELSDIKRKLGIKEVSKTSFLDKDLDND
ncbi:hypothetical protein [Fictibacillus phosphorivorans]|uniref:hypothetical protein n=1 Tax=Fictibacillus phosphorivorans TaxID=1221500 RepID=UPI001293AB84|nr:hypothetical protein [Fictibacillus phosphorivorans]